MQISQWIKTFRIAVLGSLTNLDYYVEILNTPTRFTFKVVAWFYLLLGLVLTGVFTFRDLPQINTNADEARSELINNYPETLTLDWQNGILSSNADQPIAVSFPSSLHIQDIAPKNFAIINTNTDESPNNTSALLYANRTKLFVNSLQGEWTEKALSEIIETDTFHIDKQSMLRFAQASTETQAEVISILPWFAVLYFSLGLGLFRFLMIAFNAVIVQFFFQLLNKPLTYKKVYQLSLQVLIPTEVVYQVTAFLYPHLDISMFNVSFWFIMVLVIWHLRHLKVLRIEIANGPTHTPKNE